MSRKRFVAGNWKMNTNLITGEELAKDVVAGLADEMSGRVEVVLCSPFISLSNVSKVTQTNNVVSTGAQNCSEHDSGAYTGETSVDMIASTGAEYVILGHSERRAYFGETNELLALKVNKVLDGGLKPIYCCGEVLEERKNGSYLEVITQQVSEALFGLNEEELLKVVIAYEPVWAIGTGETASPEQAQEVHKHIRQVLINQYGEDIAEQILILYGGSVKPGNAGELFGKPDIDGGLIGGAALKAEDFLAIVNA